ncbi:hypothetical protein EEI45_00630 [Erysipelothrix piscisicarius]|uniref:Mga helix-turn-helix domain-containing protein n=1 Tax=Erysipelothrix piscisicarius TaxID=2485784 RepID=A0A3S5HJY0_9FIRM|nr:helix-turn-helix domain-containing protein [Erysipelothrix piscisicarius]AZK43511.1 hypothetical protein EEI45_00630 [Erysipelothrix piscisicarius]
MKQLVSYKTQRLLLIMEALTYSKSIYISEIQNINQCSRTTIYDDIDFLINEWGSYLELTTDKTQLSMRNYAMCDLIDFKTDLLQSEFSINLLIHIFLNPYCTLYDLVDSLQYSESYIRKQISEINMYLTVYNSQIFYDPKTRKYALITYNSFTFCFLIAEILILMDMPDVLPKIEIFIDAKFWNQFNEADIFLSAHSTEILQCALNVCNLRINQKFYSMERLSHDYQTAKEMLILSNFLDETREYFDAHITKFLKENGFILSKLKLKELLDLYTIIVIKAYLFPEKIDRFSNRFDLFYQKFKRNNPYFAGIFEQYLDNFQIKFKINVREYAGEIMFELYSHVHDLRKYPILKIGIYSDLGINHNQSLLLGIRKHFTVQNLQIYNPYDHYDIVVTTSTAHVSQFHNFDELITVSDLLGQYDFMEIYNAIYRKIDLVAP